MNARHVLAVIQAIDELEPEARQQCTRRLAERTSEETTGTYAELLALIMETIMDRKYQDSPGQSWDNRT